MTTTMINLTPGKIQMNNMNILWTQNDHFVFRSNPSAIYYS